MIPQVTAEASMRASGPVRLRICAGAWDLVGRIAAILLAFVIAVFAPDAAQAIEARYRCRNGVTLTATFVNSAGAPGAVALAFGKNGGAITLPQVVSADGGRYADADTEFWIKGRGATLTRAGRSTTCQVR
jgi:membrane-bound inhibitor of C-type lysozyme